MDHARSAGRLCDSADGATGAFGSRRDLARRPPILDQARERARSTGRSENGSLAGEETKDSIADQGRLGSVAAVFYRSGRGDRRRVQEGREVTGINASASGRKSKCP